MLVWKAISSIIDIFSAISFIAFTDFCAALLQFWIVSEVFVVMLSVSRALSEFCCIDDAISSIELLTSSADDACSLAEELICWLARFISLLVLAISLALFFIERVISLRFSARSAIALFNCATSSASLVCVTFTKILPLDSSVALSMLCFRGLMVRLLKSFMATISINNAKIVPINIPRCDKFTSSSNFAEVDFITVAALV